MTLIVERFGDFLWKEAKSFSNSTNYKNFQDLESKLRRMQRFLKDADARQDNEEEVFQQVIEIKDLIYAADNMFDRYDLMLESKKKIIINFLHS